MDREVFKDDGLIVLSSFKLLQVVCLCHILRPECRREMKRFWIQCTVCLVFSLLIFYSDKLWEPANVVNLLAPSYPAATRCVGVLLSTGGIDNPSDDLTHFGNIMKAMASKRERRDLGSLLNCFKAEAPGETIHSINSDG